MDQTGQKEGIIPEGLPRELFSKFTEHQIATIRPSAWTLIHEVYRFCREHEPTNMHIKKEKSTHNERFNEVRVKSIREEIAQKLLSSLTEEQLNEKFKSIEAAALLAAQHSKAVHPYAFNQAARTQTNRRIIRPVDRVGMTRMYLVRDVLQKPVRRERRKKES